MYLKPISVINMKNTPEITIDDLLKVESVLHPRQINFEPVKEKKQVLLNNSRVKFIEAKRLGVTDTELITILMLCENYEKLIQDSFFTGGNPNQLERSLISLLDNVLNKLPAFEGEYLFRSDRFSQ